MKQNKIENSLLRHILFEKDVTFSSSLFTENRKIIYELVKEYYEKYDKIPHKDTFKLLVQDRGLDDSIASDFLDIQLAKKLDVGYLKDTLEEYEILRNTQEQIDQFNIDVDRGISVKEAHNNLASKILETKIGDGVISQGYVYETAPERWNRVKNESEEEGKLAGASFGIKCLDKYLLGRTDNSLIGFVSYPGGGKTTAMVSIAYNLARFEEQDVIYFSGELKKKQIEYMIDARDSFIDSLMIRAGNLSDTLKEKYKQSLRNQWKRKDRLWVVELEAGFRNSDLVSAIQKYRKHSGRWATTCVVDYWWLEKAEEKCKTWAEELGIIVRDARHKIAKKYDMCVIGATQESRGGQILKRNNKKRGMESIGESNKIAPHLNTCIMIDNNESSDDLTMRNKQTWSCVKNTFGPSNWEEELWYLREYSYIGDKNPIKNYSMKHRDDVSEEELNERF